MSLNERWCQISSVVYADAKEVLGHQRRRHADLFDHNDVNIVKLIDEVRVCRQQVLSGVPARRTKKRLRDARSKL